MKEFNEDNEPKTMLDYARMYTQLGWKLYRVKPGTKRGGKGWNTGDVQTEDDVRGWFPDDYKGGVGIVTGAVSRLVVIDIDGKAGSASLEALEGEHGVLPASLEVQTSRGRHLYFKHPGGGHFTNSTTALGLGIDIRADGGGVVAPPSLHVNGKHTYCWELSSAPWNAELAECPAWLVGLISKQEPAPKPNGAYPLEHLSPSSPSSPPTGDEGDNLAPPLSIGQNRFMDEGGCIRRDILRLIRATVPHQFGQRVLRQRDFVRRLSNVVTLEGARYSELEPVFREWATQAKPHMQATVNETLIHFESILNSFEQTKAAGPLGPIADRAKNAGRFPGLDASQTTHALAWVMALLAQREDPIAFHKPFFVGQRQVAPHLGVTQPAIWHCFQALIKSKFITVESTGTLASRKASTYRWIGPIPAHLKENSE